MNGLPVTDDVVDRILSFSPTFSSLLATILTSKSIYIVFQTHPDSILRAVAFNITGPALPQALRCIRHPNIVKSPPRSGARLDSDNYINANVKKSSDVGIDVGDLSAAPITAAETHLIVENAKVVARLEDLFSARYYDRTYHTSQLSQVESWNFRVAVYHCMLYSSIFDPATLTGLREDYEDENQAAARLRRRKAVDERTQFLSILSTPELLQIHSVAEFLKDTMVWCIDGFQRYAKITDLALAVGPTLILRCFDKKADSYQMVAPFASILHLLEEDLDAYPIVTEYLSGPLFGVLEARQEKLPPADFTHWYSISSRISEKNAQYSFFPPCVLARFDDPSQSLISRFPFR